MKEAIFEQTIESIISSIREAGYEPYDQLVGYVTTGNASYITRTGNARQQIQMLDVEQIRMYIKTRFR